ncbi:MAG: hypothetical protein OFPII_20930 [Osedax symbiont Rs1]|nr:MAG: hypothetical protein OFPII_20930 [Osedax symbiont Rs1]
MYSLMLVTLISNVVVVSSHAAVDHYFFKKLERGTFYIVE